MTPIAHLKTLMERANLPWVGDRYDGTVKYCVRDSKDTDVIAGNNGNGEEPYGLLIDDALLFGLINSLPALIRVVEAAARLRSTEFSSDGMFEDSVLVAERQTDLDEALSSLAGHPASPKDSQ